MDMSRPNPKPARNAAPRDEDAEDLAVSLHRIATEETIQCDHYIVYQGLERNHEDLTSSDSHENRW